MDKVYVYKLSEVVPDEGKRLTGVTYSTEEYNLKIEVKADSAAQGSLVVSAGMTNGDGEVVDRLQPTWTNRYETKGAATIEGTKVFYGRDLTEADDDMVFTFQLAAANSWTQEALDDGSIELADNGVARVTGKQLREGAPGRADFALPITIHKANRQYRPYMFSVRENLPAGGTHDGVEYDRHVYMENIYAADKGDGTLKITQIPVSSSGSSEWMNMYRASLDYDAAQALNLTKVLNGRPMADGQFGFEIKPVEGDGYVSAYTAAKKLGLDTAGSTYARTVRTPAAAADEVVTTSLLPAGGVAFDQNDVGKTFAYEVRELEEPAAGYTQDDARYRVTISIADNADGTLTATTTVEELNPAAAKSRMSRS